jgi:hypothetical protein
MKTASLSYVLENPFTAYTHRGTGYINMCVMNTYLNVTNISTYYDGVQEPITKTYLHDPLFPELAVVFDMGRQTTAIPYSP